VAALVSTGLSSSPAGAATPVLTTQASPSNLPVGVAIFDTATLAAGDNPTGTITFDLFGPDDPTCSGPPIFTSTQTVAGNGNYQSQSSPTVAAGAYQWTARYSGDANNTPVATACGDPTETVTVSRRVTTFSTQASPQSPAGTITDTATLGSGAGPTGPTGTITFELFGPDDLICAGPPVFADQVPVSGNGMYTSAPFTPTAPGTYQWVASYSGDTNNLPSFSICADPAETVVVTSVPGPVTPTLTTTASPGVVLGAQVTDTATLAGGSSPTGSITFSLYGPDNPTCSAPPVFVDTAPVAGNGTYTSDPFVPTAAGTYRWVAAYSGDANNNPVTTACADPAETVVVTSVPGPVTPTLTTTASPGVVLGAQVTDTATLAGGS
ncbi:MAG: Ig-like domain repeat protein, partial [Actinobacteria bacterium]|nr:Ig-like domain repeat protein [Actinomycetota bacterium]